MLIGRRGYSRYTMRSSRMASGGLAVVMLGIRLTRWRSGKTRGGQGRTGAPSVVAIFYNNPDYYPPIINELRMFASRRWPVRLIARKYGERWAVDYPNEADIRRVASWRGGSWGEYLGFLLSAARLATTHPSIFVGHDAHGFLAARVLSFLWRRPVVYRCHDFIDDRITIGRGARLVHSFEKRFARTADLVIVPDRDRGAVIQRELNLRRAPLVVANAPLRRPGQSGGALHAALARQNRWYERVVLRQGRIGPGHAIEATVRSMPLWARRDWGLVLLGFADAGYVRTIMELAEAVGVANQLAVLPPVRYDDVALYTAGADVGHALYDPVHINHTHYATASNKIMEYMAASVPLLVSGTPELRALVADYGCGMVADEACPHSIAAAVNALLADRAVAAEMGRAGAKAFEEVFCFERQSGPALDAIGELYRQESR